MFLSEILHTELSSSGRTKDKKEIACTLDKVQGILIKSLTNELDELAQDYQLLLDIKRKAFDNEPCESCDNLISYYAERCRSIREILKKWGVNLDQY